jgi:hypothetical protein
MTDDFFIRLERQLEAAELRELNRAPALRRIANPRRLLSMPVAAAGAVGVLVVVLVSMGTLGRNDVERQAQPVGAVPLPTMEAVAAATGVDRVMSFSLEERVLTVQLLPAGRDELFETVSGARISATCGAPPGDPGSETTLTRRWPAGETRASFRFPRDVSTWCRLEDRSGRTLASVRLTGPGVPPEARERITETANNWARLFAATDAVCNDYTTRALCEGPPAACEGDGCTPGGWAAEHRGATVHRIAVSGDRAAATLASPEGVELETLQLRRTATGEWLIERLGPIGAVGSSK